MLIKCPECELQVSDKAIACPHCGYPLNKQTPVQKEEYKRKRKRLPNGFGQITKLKNKNLRNRYRAMVTINKDSHGKPICKLLQPKAYFSTYNEAYTALLEYNKNPIELADRNITMDELYKLWSKQKSNELKNKRSMMNYIAAWQYATILHNVKLCDVRVTTLKKCINNAFIIKDEEQIDASANTKNKLKIMLNMLFDFAVENELTTENIARKFKLDKLTSNELQENIKHHTSFTKDEFDNICNKYKEIKYGDIILCQCYGGWRPSEILDIKTSNVDLENMTIVGGMKSKNGINRVVPIHSKIYKLIEAQYKLAIVCNSDTLFFKMVKDKPKPILIIEYRKVFHDNHIFSADHTPHDCRKQFVTMAKEYNLDEYAIKRIVGHSIQDLTERVYTDRNIEWLKNEIEKIV